MRPLFRSLPCLLPLFAATSLSAQTTGDFNDDGYADLAVGIPGEDVGPVSGCGAVAVLYGSASGLTTAGSQFWHQDLLGLRNEALDYFGWSLAAGDLDGDGIDDLAVGVPYEDETAVNQGAAVLILGSPSGLTAAGSKQLLDGCTGGGETDDLYGFSLAIEKWDRSLLHREALAVGVPYEDVGSVVDAGMVELRWSAFDDQATISCFTQGGSFGETDTPEAGDRFGWSVAIANVDFSLTFNDLIVGVPREDVNGAADAGAVQVFFLLDIGGIYGLGPLFLTDADAASGGVEAGDQFGWSLAVGRFHNDGLQLAIGVPFERLGALSMAGRVAVRRAQSLASHYQSWNQDSPLVLDQAEAFDQFGYALVAADFNDDGFDDLAIGTPAEDSASTFDCGATAVLFGAAAGLSGIGDRYFFDGVIATGGIESSDLLGLSVAAGDCNGDGLADLAMGVPYENLGTTFDAGEVQVRFGPLPVVGATVQAFHQDTMGLDDSAEASDWFGRALH